MPRKKTQSKEAKQRLLPRGNEQTDDLHTFINEADQVQFMTEQLGWDIIVRDFTNYKKQKSEEIPYLNKDSKEFNEAVIDYRAVDKLFRLIDDYRTNRQKAIEALEKLDNPDKYINLDVDN